jgi:hypothetical protein
MESCISAWPMPDMQAQIQSLREAFSADTSKPFELKRGFPYGSPGHRLEPSPPLDLNFGDSLHSNPQITFHATPITPPISAGHEDKETYNIMGVPRSQPSIPSGNALGDENIQWNPKGIFEYVLPRSIPRSVMLTPPPSQWNTAFGTPATTLTNMPLQSPSSYSSSSTVTTHDLTGFTQADSFNPSGHRNPSHSHSTSQPQSITTPINTNNGIQYSLPSQLSPVSATPQPTTYTSPHAFVSPAMWQDTVADTFDPTGSLKRRWSRANMGGVNSQIVQTGGGASGGMNGMINWGAGEEQSAKRVR